MAIHQTVINTFLKFMTLAEEKQKNFWEVFLKDVETLQFGSKTVQYVKTTEHSNNIMNSNLAMHLY